MSRAALLRGREKSLARWFVTHHADFAGALALVSRPSWSALTEELQREGLTKHNGQPITASYARKMWWKISPDVPVGDVQQAMPAVEPAPVATEEEDDDAKWARMGFRTASVKDWTK